ncbi:glycosyltransferase family 4 protein [Stieleria sp. JC731]|uniref:glycosyltransferase family 4 protein n=1 Tax=Pirellulaceae TaxID=2691357 RepID=UPI001E51A624|nr:glycosyltransferase family 1 protein [Stieleria sp. JC731]MCC9599486.1 glycosyltransferase family 4 protein [Stieleria sp. JC731]
MRILYEGAIFQILRCGGVARYFSELIRHLPETFEPIVVGPPNEQSRLDNPSLRYVSVQTEPPVSWLRKWTRDRLQRQIIQRFDSIETDIEHWTYYGGLCRRPIVHGKRPLVVTVLDFIHEAYPSLDPSGKHVAMKNEAIRLADHLACISHSTFNELCERFPEARHKASVVPLGTSLENVNPAPIPSTLAKSPYVLFVGRRNNYKNFQVVWEAWKKLNGRRPKDAKLAIVGPPMKRREATALGFADDSSTVLLPNASDEVLRGLYEHAKSFIFPSKAEGFGLPSLEAMCAGTPVLVSDLPVMHEVVGDDGYYFDPDDVDTVAEMMLASLEDGLPNRDSVVQSAKDRASTFRWQATAERMAEVYVEVSLEKQSRRPFASACSIS